jgi:hypothetical protein
MKILICVPDKLRDLEGHALVAFHLIRRHGHDVRLIEPFSVESAFLQHALTRSCSTTSVLTSGWQPP